LEYVLICTTKCNKLHKDKKIISKSAQKSSLKKLRRNMVRTKNGTTAVSSSSGNINECITLHVYVQKVNIDR